MTREEKLYSMRMQDLEIVAAKLGIKINKKGAKSKAIEKILEAENENWEKESNEMKDAQEKKQQESDKAAEDAVNKKQVQPKAATEAPKTDSKAAEKVQKQNHSRTNLKLTELTFEGQTKTIREWANEKDMPVPTLYDRVNRNGWTVEEALTIPLGGRRSR